MTEVEKIHREIYRLQKEHEAKAQPLLDRLTVRWPLVVGSAEHKRAMELLGKIC